MPCFIWMPGICVGSSHHSYMIGTLSQPPIHFISLCDAYVVFLLHNDYWIEFIVKIHLQLIDSAIIYDKFHFETSKQWLITLFKKPLPKILPGHVVIISPSFLLSTYWMNVRLNTAKTSSIFSRMYIRHFLFTFTWKLLQLLKIYHFLKIYFYFSCVYACHVCV